MKVKCKKVHEDAELPRYSTVDAACFDIKAVVDGGYESVVHGHGTKFRTGLAFEIPVGHVMLVFPRSGLAIDRGVRLTNCTAVIDSDYRGELFVSLTSDREGRDYLIRHGDRIAQGMVLPYPSIEFVEATELSATARGVGGLGSTGR